MENIEELMKTVICDNYDYNFEKNVISRSVQSLHDGGKTQLVIAVEELGELSQAIINNMVKVTDRINLMEEITDVRICFVYLENIFDTTIEEIHVDYFNYDSREEFYTDAISFLLILQQQITKYLRGKIDGRVALILEKARLVTGFLSEICRIENISNNDIIKIRKLKIDRLNDIVLETEKGFGFN